MAKSVSVKSHMRLFAPAAKVVTDKTHTMTIVKAHTRSGAQPKEHIGTAKAKTFAAHRAGIKSALKGKGPADATDRNLAGIKPMTSKQIEANNKSAYRPGMGSGHGNRNHGSDGRFI